MIVIVTSLCIYTAYNCKINKPSKLSKNTVIVNYVATIGDYSSLEIQDSLKHTRPMNMFFVIDILIPTIYVLFALILLIILCKKIIDFFKNVNSKNALFTNEKLISLRKNFDILMILMLFIVFSCDSFAIISLIVLIFIRQFTLYLFKNSVEMNTKS